MGIKINAQQNGNIEYVNAVKHFLEIYMERFFSVIMRNQFLFSFTKKAKLYNKSLKILKGFTENVIENRKKERGVTNEKNKVHEDEFGVKRKVAFLDLLLELSEEGAVLTDQEIREETDTFMFEVRWTFLYLISA